MQYFFVMGNNPSLSLAELTCVLHLQPRDVSFLSPQVVIINSNVSLDFATLLQRLGGTIKMGMVNDEYSILDVQTIFNAAIFNDLDAEKKFNFGFSYYGDSKLFDEKQTAMELKKLLKERGVSSRWVTSREKTLSSVVVTQNKLTTEQGAEIVIIEGKDTYYLGRTQAVQPFKELSKRDYGRPNRDDYSGMLPPKLAQMMINLVNATDAHGLVTDRHGSRMTLLDPFCGSGTILTEAALMGYKNIIGSDKSPKAVADSKTNFQFLIANRTANIFQCDVQKLSQRIKPRSVDAIVTEPYLGPSRGHHDVKALARTAHELEQLYHQAVLQFEKILKPQGRVVMVWPVFVHDGKQIYLNTKNILKNSSLYKVNVLQGFLKKGSIALTDRDTLLYRRAQQKVHREILVLQRKG